MTTTTIEQLEKKIDELIRAHIADVRLKAAAAVERAFASVAVKASPATSGARRPAVRRRGADEIGELGARLHKAVCANPGASMTILAKSIGKTPAELERSAKLLKRTGKIRSVGVRSAARYFPLTSKTA